MKLSGILSVFTIIFVSASVFGIPSFGPDGHIVDHGGIHHSNGTDGGSDRGSTGSNGNSTDPNGTEKQKAEVLAEINKERLAVGVPPLQWSNELEANAQAYVNKLMKDESCEIKASDPSTRVDQGERIAQFAINSEADLTNKLLDTVKVFNSQKACYKPGLGKSNYENIHCTSGPSGGKVNGYTQNVWRGTKFVGCAQNTGSKCAQVVCRYFPPGNYNQEDPFVDSSSAGTVPETKSDSPQLDSDSTTNGGGNSTHNGGDDGSIIGGGNNGGNSTDNGGNSTDVGGNTDGGNSNGGHSNGDTEEYDQEDDNGSPDPNPISNHGGEVLTQDINVYYIYYGQFKSEEKDLFETFIKGVSSTSYWNITRKYYSQKDQNSPKTYASEKVNLAGTYDAPLSFGNSLSGNNIPDMIQQAINDKKVKSDPNAMYAVLLGEGVSESSKSGAFCKDYCGYHTGNQFQDGNKVPYFMVGNPSQCPGCGLKDKSPNNLPAADAMISTIAHELVEATTDPFVNNYYDDKGNEVMDKCAYNFGKNVKVDSNGAEYNIKINGKNFLTQKIFDPETQRCRMKA